MTAGLLPLWLHPRLSVDDPRPNARVGRGRPFHADLLTVLPVAATEDEAPELTDRSSSLSAKFREHLVRLAHSNGGSELGSERPPLIFCEHDD